ncbi:MAG TPA: ABC transporter permease [Bacteroidota bacterium]|nr:ABC transporter permease [Bacteroidota bacterium]
MTTFALRCLLGFFRPPFETKETLRHIDELGAKSLPLVGTTGLIVGLILAIQSRPVLARFGAELYVPAMVSISVVRELGPILSALMVAGRVGSGISAELGSMRVTEQIDAMEVSGIDSFRFLVVTRVLACTLILPLLTGIFNVLAILGAFVPAVTEMHMSWTLYFHWAVYSLWLRDVVPAILKTLAFGFIIGVIGSHHGYTVSGGTEGVGHASTNAVVTASLLLLFSDMILAKLIVLIWN